MATASVEILREDGSYTVRYSFDYVNQSSKPWKLIKDGLYLFINYDNYKRRRGVSYGYYFKGSSQANEPVLTYQELKEIIKKCYHCQQKRYEMHGLIL